MDPRAEYIQAGRNVDPDFDANVLVHRGAGSFEGIKDIELAWALRVIDLNGFSEAQGSTRDGASQIAAGPFILRTDAQGFHSLHITASADDAVTLVETADEHAGGED